MIKIHVARNRIEEGQPAIVVESESGVKFTDEVTILGDDGMVIGRFVQDDRGMDGRKQIRVWFEIEEGHISYASE